MRGTVAEQRNVPGGSRGDNGRSDLTGTASRAGGGYSLQPTPRSGGQALRSSGGRWEVRLGTIQVAVWLGLALGACVGGYFVGFFSGRYVGFESARESSAGSVLKLPAPEMIADSSALNPNPVYDRLKAPAILPETTSPRASVKSPVNNTVDTAVKNQVTKPSNTALDANSDEIFDDTNSGGELIIGSDEGLGIEQQQKLPSSVKIIGGEKNARIGDIPTVSDSKNEAVVGSASSAASILDARIANARSELGRVAEEGDDVDSTKPTKAAEVKKAVNEAPSKSLENNGLVRKVLPAGYFAQVSAPKKIAEAESEAKRLKRSGFPVVIESASVNGQSFYRVLVGPEENKVQAERLVGQLQSESFVAGKPFIRRVK
jgi:cell division septation protein DedD